MILRWAPAFAAMLFTGCAGAGEDASSDDTVEETSEALTSYQRRVSDHLRRGSQPDHGALVRLRNDGYRAIVNLRESNGERGDVLALGMNPHHIGVVDREAPSEAQVIDFLDFATQRPNQPVFVHCQAGQGRTGVFVAAYRMAVQRWSLRDAMREANSLGMTSPRQVRFVTDFANSLAAGRIRHFAPER